jgi:hypothetical protein
MLPVFVEKFLHFHIRHVTTSQLVLRVPSELYTATINLIQKYDVIIELALLTTFHCRHSTPWYVWFLSQVETHGWSTSKTKHDQTLTDVELITQIMNDTLLVAGSTDSQVLSRCARTTWWQQRVSIHRRQCNYKRDKTGRIQSKYWIHPLLR